ncbi:MAG: deoxyguanosinetriphosphate triphosphohydrolase [Terriglobia bacterium]
MSVRDRFEQEEENTLSPRARRSVETKGRARPEEPDSLRTCFQRDRDRVIHAKAFRRLAHKTQVFLTPEGDHYRTRLTHTLEVSQISRTIARALGLNQDLTEAIALGHDLGHTPFGHIGEQALTQALGEENGRFGWPRRFDHNLQSLRVVEAIEYGGKGLNLTFEVLDGIRTHTGSEMPSTLEAEVVRIADRVAYINHDIDDAVRGGIISQNDLPAEPVRLLGKHHSLRVSSMVTDLISNSRESDHIRMSQEIGRVTDEMRDFLFEKVYENDVAKGESPKAQKVLQGLFAYYLETPTALPAEFKPTGQQELAVKVCDYIAGMTDRYAIRRYEEIFMPKAWTI